MRPEERINKNVNAIAAVFSIEGGMKHCGGFPLFYVLCNGKEGPLIPHTREGQRSGGIRIRIYPRAHTSGRVDVHSLLLRERERVSERVWLRECG